MLDLSNYAKDENPWKVRLWLLMLSHLAGTVNIVSVLAMAPIISREFQLSATEFGFLVTAYYGGQAIFSVPSGMIVDRYGIGKSLVASHIVMALSAILLSIAEGYGLSILSLLLMGVGYSLTNPATGRAVLMWFSSNRRGTAMGIKQVGVPLGGVVAAANGALASIIDWHFIMLMCGVLILANGFFCISLISKRRDHIESKPKSLSNIKKVMVMPQLHINTILNGFINVGQINFFSFLTLFLRDIVLVSQPMAGLAMGVAQATSAVGRIFWGIICDKWFLGRRRVLMAVLCGAGSIFLAAMAALQPSSSMIFGFLLVSLLGLTIAAYAPIAQAITVEMVPPNLSGSALGYNLMGVFLGGMLGPPIFGLIIDISHSFKLGWLLTALITAIGTMILIRFFKEGQSAN